MLAILSLVLIASATALNLPAPTITALVTHQFSYGVTPGQSIQSVTSKISNIQPALGFADANYLNQIGGDLKFHIDAMEHTPYRSLTWTLKINRALGLLRVIQITATLQGDNRTLTLLGKYVEVTQPIPPVFDVQTVCHKGGRKYGIAGPRKEICDNIQTPRGLNGQEIAEINQALVNMIPQATARLN